MKHYFITAIGTDSGKSLVSAIVTEALKADYWKVVQAGNVETDKETVMSLVSNTQSVFHNESYLLDAPESPHSSAAKQGVTIDIEKIKLPTIENEYLVTEGAGGILVPLNDDHLVIDLAGKFDCEVILVSNVYLGSINHTLLTVNELKRRKLKVRGVIFNGDENLASKKYILQYSGYQELLSIPTLETVDEKVVKHYAEKVRKNLMS